MLHLDGADGATTFTDTSIAAHTVNAVGNAQLDTAQFKFGVSSALFDGAGDGLQVIGGANFAFGAGDFTIEGFVRLGATGIDHVIYESRAGAEGLFPTVGVTTGNKLIYYTNGLTRITSSTSLTTGVQYHWAVARSGTSTKLFLAGTQEGSTYSDSNVYLNSASRPYLAIGQDGAVAPLNGWLDEIHVSKGIARYTANFTPPAAALAHESVGAAAGVGDAVGTGNSTAASIGTAAGTGTATGTGAAYGIGIDEADVVGSCAAYFVRGHLGASYDVTGEARV